MDQPVGAHLENLVLSDLLAWRDARVDRAELGYWRTTIGDEIDLCAGGTLVATAVVRGRCIPLLRD